MANLSHFQIVPILFNNKTIKMVNGWFSTFIWKKDTTIKNGYITNVCEAGRFSYPKY